MNVSALLAANGRKYPDRAALIAENRQVSFSEWNRLANNWACHLREAGVEPGNRVVVMMPNCPEFAIMYIAVVRAGAIIVPINARSTREEGQYICGHAQAAALVVHEALLPAVASLATDIPGLLTIKTGASQDGWSGTADWPEAEQLPVKMKALSIDPELHWAHAETEVSMLYTSGTTGRPKGVLFTHRNLMTVAQMIALEMAITHRSRILHLMPLSHSAPLHLSFLPAIMVGGATQVMAPAFSPELLLSLVQEHRITHFFGAPVAYLLAMKHPQFASFDLSSVRYWMYGGAPLTADMALGLETAYGRQRLVCVYGLTEAGPTGTCLMHGEHPEKVGSVGRAVLFTEVEVVDEAGVPVAAGEAGEIRIRGEGSMKGYYNDPVATGETLRDGWIYSGDIGRLDEDGFLWVIDRKKDVVITGGVNVYPKEVEQELERHPAVQEVVVIGVPHPEWGETITACLVLKPGIDPEQDWLGELRRLLDGRLAAYKWPRQVKLLDALPRNTSGKILKHALRQAETAKGVEQV